MGATRKIKKEISKKRNLYYTLCDLPYGSLYLSLSMFIPRLRKGSFAFINYMSKLNNLPYIDDPQFMKKMLDIYGVKKEEAEEVPLICIDSAWNRLFFPYVTDVNTHEITILPVRPDGTFPSSCQHMKGQQFVDWDSIFSEIEYKVEDE